MLIHAGFPQRYRQIMGSKSVPLVVEAESAYRDLDATSANGIQFTLSLHTRRLEVLR